MRCHYEVMSLAKEATPEEIKKQYRKLALQWHPDRNNGQEELATQNFKEVSAAYSVLSDPQERAWYDSHREAILLGSDGTSSEDVDIDYTPNLFKYFSTSCFTEFDDSATGFYPVYNRVFESIAEVEESRGTTKMSTFVPFGSSISEEADVYNFYNNWENFITTLTFTWEDKFNILEAPNRQVKRAMEKENSKYRDVARKEYINLVRSLVAYVKKRDQRLATYETARKLRKDKELAQRAEIKRLEKEKKRLQMEKWREEAEGEAEQREEERKRAFLLADNDSDFDDDDMDRFAHAVSLVEDLQHVSAAVVETATDNNEEQTTAQEEEEEEEELVFACEICDKEYKTSMQLEQHLASKNHRKKEQELNKKKPKGGGSSGSKKASSSATTSDL